ncbi:tigger transposable element-derived protein 6 [Nematostella vectensis]|uniref:tigger transposable element-derived protein 6 n=1 Tax=Nematostella vectensis TaxID=45351 RepID=UPI002076E0A5|nr:tigger transposable element-derived protein 6 [Nematostella vectensis]
MRCSGGKKSKQRNTWAQRVNAAGEKELPIVIGRSENPRCFKNLPNKQYPYTCRYFANDKAWIRTEIMQEVLAKLNRRLKRENRNIMLFMDNAPCHPPSLKNTYSNIKIIFFPKNTTSKTQPLDSGIIANWKIHYKKRMLRFICSKVSATITATDIVKSIDVLMSIEWGKQAWVEVQESYIIKCFKSTGLYPDTEPVDDDPFEGENLVQHEQIDTMLATLSAPCTAQEFLDIDANEPTCQLALDPTRADWRDQAREIYLIRTI